jgi:hypothetical protein
MRTIATLEKFALAGADYRHWYRWARADIRKACAAMGVDPDEFTDILAVTSPRVSVTRNVRYALMLVENPHVKPHDMMRTVYAAYTYWLETGEIRGPKTNPFSRALKGDLSAIPLDVWMSRALNVPHVQVSRVACRREACKRIRAVARRLGWKPAEVQAAIWATAMRQAGRNVQFVSIMQNMTLWDQKVA